MRYRFNETNIATGLIKELLKEFNLPMYTVYTEGKPIYPGKLYIKNSTIYVGEGSGDRAELVPVNDYIYNQKQINMTKNLVINSSVYDSYTHTYLGNYLRFMRDYNKLNLMPLYNCFNTETLEGVNQFISLSSGNTFEINTYNTSNTYYLIPIKFNEQYTIAIDSPVTYELACMIYTPSGLTDLSKELMADTYKKIPGSQFSSPYIFSTDFDATKYWSFENNLRLLIKLPAIASNSTITVLEGNYTASARCQNSIVSSFAIDDKNGFGIYPTRLSLLDMNDGVSYPFADRLLEYLSNNAIVPQEKITDNIGRLQRAVYNNSRFKGAYDIWDPQLRISLFNRLNDKTSKKNFYNIYREDVGNTPASKMSLLLGNTTQKTLGGKNLLPQSTTTSTKNGITFTPLTNGGYHVQGTATANAYYVIDGGYEDDNVPLPSWLVNGQTYTISGSTSSVSAVIYLYGQGQFNNRNFTVDASQIHAYGTFIYVGNGTTVNTNIYPQIEKGSSATAYEQYCGGIPSPNPDYPQEIHSVSGDNEILITGKNILSPTFEDKSIYYVNKLTGFYSVVAPQELSSGVRVNVVTKSSGYAVLSTNISSCKDIRRALVNNQNSKYTFSCDLYCSENTNISISIRNNDGSNPLIDFGTFSTWAGHKMRIYRAATSKVAAEEFQRLYISIANLPNNSYIELGNFQLEKGEIDTSYEPYKAQVYPLSLPAENYLANNATVSRNADLTIEAIANGGLKINGTRSSATVAIYNFATNGTSSDQNTETKTIPNGTYYITTNSSNANLRLQVMGSNSAGTSSVSTILNAPNGVLTIDDTYAYNWVRLYVTGGTYIDEIIYPQITKGTKPARYTPYGSPSIELNALSTFKDYIHKENGKWYLHKAFDKADLGSLTWARRKTNIFSSSLPTSANVSGDVGSFMSNYFIVEYAAGYAATNPNKVAMYKASSTTSTTTIYLNLSSVDTVADLTTWFSTNATELVYPLATPTETEITDTTLISQLEELSKATGYDGETNIIQSNNDLSFDISNLEKILDLNKDIAEESKPIVDINENIKFIDTTPDLLSYGDKDVETFLGVAR